MGLNYIKSLKGEPEFKTVSQVHRNSFDSGVDVNDSSEESTTITSVSDSMTDSNIDENNEIEDFIKNKDLYTGKKIGAPDDDFNFDDYLYCYKSFHSPLIDKEYHGYSMKDIQKASKAMEMRKREQLHKSIISKSLQLLNSKKALLAWRDNYKQQKLTQTFF